ncbi:MAG: Ig-like domain-containing protein, partial [Bacteroidota bacterium]|nr:Ig-like domain-containing protein [Bacteroidota bacterium]
IVASNAGEATDEATANITVKGIEVAPFETITWGDVANQPHGTHESLGRAVGEKVYIFGGFDVLKQPNNWTPTKRSYVYDPVNNSYTQIADLPYTPNGDNYGGVSHAGIATDGTDIYFAAGYTSNNSGTGQIFGTKQAWKYNVSANSYTSLPDLPIATSTGQMEYLNGRLHYISGTNVARNEDLGIHYVLDLDKINEGWKTRASLPNPRQHAGSAVFKGKIYFIGGQTGHDQQLVTQKDVHVYDPETDEWTKVADLPVPNNASGRGHITSAVVVYGDRIIVLGGETAHGTKTNLVSAYSPAENTWSALTPLPQTSMAGVASVLNNQIYFTGGDFRKTNRRGTPVFLTNPSPTVVISKPADTDSFNEGSDITIEAEATISGGTITKVEFFADNNKLGEDTEAPYSYIWANVAAGIYLLTAKATSNKGESKTSSSVEIIVSSNIPPTVEITSPENGTIFSEEEPINILVEAEDADGTVELVEFFQGNNKIGEVNLAPFQINWFGAGPGTYDLTAKAYDNEGGTTTSSSVTISVMRVNNLYPEVSIVSPEAGAEFIEGSNIDITAEANDEDGSVKRIEFYSGTTKLGQVINEPYTFSWQNVAPGTYEITAVAFDNEGASTESDPVTIEVQALFTCQKTGGLLREYWQNVTASELSSFDFEKAPTGNSELTSFEAPEDFTDNYITRLRGYICPPATGHYTFWISSSHKSELWISDNESINNKRKIAFSQGNEKDSWEHDASQKSEPILLTAGQTYFIEAIHLSGSGDDHFAVGWQWPNGKTERPIPGQRLIKYESGV